MYGFELKPSKLSASIAEKNILGLERETRQAGIVDLGRLDEFSIYRELRLPDGDFLASELIYNLKLEGKQANYARFTWEWEEGEQPVNTHRIVDGEVRGRGIGGALLELSEQALKRMGFKQAFVLNRKPAATSWFFKKGYDPIINSENVIKIIDAIRSRKGNFQEVFGIKLDRLVKYL